MQLNVGLTDGDFDVRNPEYQFDLDQLGLAPANNGAAEEVAELGARPTGRDWIPA